MNTKHILTAIILTFLALNGINNFAFSDIAQSTKTQAAKVTPLNTTSLNIVENPNKFLNKMDFYPFWTLF